MTQEKKSYLVYSSEFGRICPKCENPTDKCICRKQENAPETDGVVRVGIERKGRKGKGVTIISGLPLNSSELKDLAKQFKQLCGSGGTVKKNVIEIQGDHRDLLMKALKDRGYTVKKSGG